MQHKDKQEYKGAVFERIFVPTFQAAPFLTRGGKSDFRSDVRSKELKTARKQATIRVAAGLGLGVTRFEEAEGSAQGHVDREVLITTEKCVRPLRYAGAAQ